MNLLCPSCHNPLAVPEQYAGQLMKCPLCNNNFTVPALPPSVGPTPALSPDSPGAGRPSASPESTSVPVAVEPDIYTLEPAASPSPSPPAPAVSKVESVPKAESTKTGPAPARLPSTSTPGGFTRTVSMTLNPHVMPWIAPISLILVFIFSFFPWVGRFPGDYGVVTQSAWGAAFGGYSVDEVFNAKSQWEKNTNEDEKPGFSPLLILFLLALLPAVFLGVAAIALPMLEGKVNIPPQAIQLKPWRWLIAAGVTLVALLFLLLQLITNFSIESRTYDAIETAMKTERDKAQTAEERKWVSIKEGEMWAKQALHRTIYPRLSFLLLILAAASAAATHWLEHRGPGRPLPRLELMW